MIIFIFYCKQLYNKNREAAPSRAEISAALSFGVQALGNKTFFGYIIDHRLHARELPV